MGLFSRKKERFIAKPESLYPPDCCHDIVKMFDWLDQVCVNAGLLSSLSISERKHINSLKLELINRIEASDSDIELAVFLGNDNFKMREKDVCAFLGEGDYNGIGKFSYHAAQRLVVLQRLERNKGARDLYYELALDPLIPISDGQRRALRDGKQLIDSEPEIAKQLYMMFDDEVISRFWELCDTDPLEAIQIFARHNAECMRRIAGSMGK